MRVNVELALTSQQSQRDSFRKLTARRFFSSSLLIMLRVLAALVARCETQQLSRRWCRYSRTGFVIVEDISYSVGEARNSTFEALYSEFLNPAKKPKVSNFLASSGIA